MGKAKIKTKKIWTLEKTLPWILIICGAVATAASVLLSVEVFNKLKNPGFVPICNLNPVLSCTSVADSAQSHVFGIPNYFIGIAGYAAVAALGIALATGARFRRRLWLALLVSLVFSMGFVTWLQFQSLYRIGALCIFC